MKEKTESHTKILIILILAVVAGLIYLLSISVAYPVFQNTRLIDPLAEMNSLFPLYYVAIALTALLGVGCLIWRIENKCLHIMLLSMFAVMLWFTPYYLAGFVRLPDVPWHVGIALQIPQVLGGDPVAFSGYAWSYPGSFIYHYTFLNILGMEPTSYISNFFPFLCLLLFVLLCYVLAAKLFSHKVAFLSMLIAIPGIHYIHLHPSPHTIGALLMLTALLLLTRRGAAAKIIAIMAIIIIVISHPTTPLLLSIFLAAALLTSTVYSRRIGRTQVALASVFLICFVGWFSWFSFGPPWGDAAGGAAGTTAGSTLGSTEYLYYMATLVKLGVVQEYLTGTPFIYGNIHNLNKGIYFLYAAAAILGILYIAARTYSGKRSIRNWVSKFGGLNRSEMLMAFSVLFLLVLTFLLAKGAHDLIETGLTYIILAVSCIIASVIVRLYRSGINRRIISSAVTVGVLFLTLSFHIVAYSIDAYSSFPESEEAGLKFLAADIPLDEKTIAANWAAHLALYIQSPLNQIEFVSPYSEIQPDLVILRSTGYYYAAMRLDLTFENNRFNEYRKVIENSNYNLVYSNPSFVVYEKTNE